MQSLSLRRAVPLALFSSLALVACGDDDTVARDGGADTSISTDTGSPDTSRPDASPPPPPPDAGEDAGDAAGDATPPEDAMPPVDAEVDSGLPDAGDPCAPQDVRGEGACDAAFGVFWLGGRCGWVSGCSCVGADCDAGFEDEAACERAYAACLPGADCRTDADCTSGAQWCTGGRCVPCDNSGLLCDIACADGFTTYVRNGCSPCACAPVTECSTNDECAGGERCYAGRFCWDWCPPGDPSCCLGNFCDRGGCPDDPPIGCNLTGCPEGQECRSSDRCFSSSCFCGEAGAWGCTRDCIMMACAP